jgi:hypothetical protein
MRAQAGYRDPESATSGIPVFDGPEYGITGDNADTWLCVGWSGDPDAPQSGASASQTIATLGNRSREEIGSINLRAMSQKGDRDIQARRNAAFAVMGDLETLLRNDPLIGLSPLWMREAQIGERYSIEQRFDGGAQFTLDFVIFYRARI